MIDLIALIHGQRRNSRSIDLRPIEESAVSSGELFRIMVQVARAWATLANQRILPAYGVALEQARPLRIDGLTQDTIDDVGAEVENAESEVARLIIRLTPNIRAWQVRAERVHRGRLTNSIKTATGVDLSTILTIDGVQTTLDAQFQTNLDLIRNINESTRARIGQIVFRGFQARAPRRQIAKEIAEAVGMSRKRALRIAADQTTKLSAALDRERQEELGIKKFRWRHSGKVHPRPHHKARDGKLYPWKNNGLNGDLPGVAINCGCKAQAHIDL